MRQLSKFLTVKFLNPAFPSLGLQFKCLVKRGPAHPASEMNFSVFSTQTSVSDTQALSENNILALWYLQVACYMRKIS